MKWVRNGDYWRFRSHHGMKTSRGPRNRVDKDVVFIDVDDDVVILDAPSSLFRKHRKSRVADKKDSAPDNVICLDADDDDEFDRDRCNDVKLDRNLSDGASTSKRSGADESTSKRDTKGKRTPPVKLSKGKRTYSGISTPDADCEVMEDCFIVREQWEKASSKRKFDARNGQSDAEHPQVIFKGGRQKDKVVNEHFGQNDKDSGTDSEMEDDPDCKILKENVIPENLYRHEASSSKEPPCEKVDSFSRPLFENDGSSSLAEEDRENNPPNANKETPEYVSHTWMNSDEGTPLHDKDASEDDPDCKILKENVIPVTENLYRHGEDGHAGWKASSSKEPPCDDDNFSKFENDGSSSFAEDDRENNPPNANEETPEYMSNTWMNSSEDAPLHDKDSSEDDPVCVKENVIPVAENLNRHGEADHAGWKASSSKEPPCDDNFGGSSSFIMEDKENNPSNANKETPEYMSSGEDAKEATEGCMKGDREKYKETDEYKKALAEELALREESLRIQAEAAQNLRRERKRERAESMRLLDMERRQKQRIEEMRETQKKDEEDMNLKEAIRAFVRNDLLQIERSCYNMSSLLQRLGIMELGILPSQNEVRLAYKKALLKFHPDRSSRSDMRQQVEAEEKFKLITRMKERFSFVW